jgi:hypothetical protein
MKSALSKYTLSIYLMLSFFHLSYAQPAAMQRKKNPYKWMVSLDWSAIDDNGEAFTKLFDLPGSWNYEYFPTRLMVDRFYYKGWSFEGTATYNRYYTNKQINDTTGLSGSFFALNFGMKYSFNRYFRNAKWLDPYISMGLGGTYRTVRDQPLTPQLYTTFGANFWFSRKWGVQLQTTGNLAIVSDIYTSDADYLQHVLGVVYRFDSKKRSKNTFRQSKYKWVHDRKRAGRRQT